MIRLINDDPHCQIIISTVAFSNGLNAESLLDSLSLGFAPTFDESWQEKGHVGHNPDTIGRGIILANRSIIETAEAYLRCEYFTLFFKFNSLLILFQLLTLFRSIIITFQRPRPRLLRF